MTKLNQTRSPQGQTEELWTLIFVIWTSFDNVLLEHGELPCVLPLAVHLDLGHLLNTLRYLGLLSEPCTPTQIQGGVGWVVHKILVTAQRPHSTFYLDLTWTEAWPGACQFYISSFKFQPLTSKK